MKTKTKPEQTFTKEQAQKIISESNRRAQRIRHRRVVPTAVRVEDPGGGVYSVQIVDLSASSSGKSR